MKNELIDKEITALKKRGLNLIAAIKIKNLPEEVKSILQDQLRSIDSESTLCLIAHGGKSLWENLKHPLNADLNPIDQYSIDQMNLFSQRALGEKIEILFPNPNYILPLQKLGRLLNLSRASLLNIDINPNFGLWFAFRGAFLSNSMPEFIPETFPSPCDSCIEKPCLNEIHEHLKRLSCSFKAEHRYGPEQLKYHSEIVKKYISDLGD